jgi:uracil-DNA glycosylase
MALGMACWWRCTTALSSTARCACARRCWASTTATCAASRCRWTPRWTCCRACRPTGCWSPSPASSRAPTCSACAGRRACLPRRRGLHARADPGLALAGAVRDAGRVTQLLLPVASVMDEVHADWRGLLDDWARGPAGQGTMNAVDRRVSEGAIVYPDRIFRALELTTAAADPGGHPRSGSLSRRGTGRRPGLLGAARQRIPPSLRNIHRELQRDLALVPPLSGSLQAWARQGVLLLNTTLTVEHGRAGSHAKLGWQALTDAESCKLCGLTGAKSVLAVGGSCASPSQALSPSGPHCVLTSNHPSPLSASRPPVPFIGNGHFSAGNRFRQKRRTGGGGVGLDP